MNNIKKLFHKPTKFKYKRQTFSVEVLTIADYFESCTKRVTEGWWIWKKTRDPTINEQTDRMLELLIKKTTPKISADTAPAELIIHFTKVIEKQMGVYKVKKKRR